MSHYAVAVFSCEPEADEFDRLLEPYNEGDERYFVFEPASDAEIDSAWERFKKNNPDWNRDDWLKGSYTNRNGLWGYWSNPNAKWDWYTLDGRDGLFDAKPGVLEEIGKMDSSDAPLFLKKSQIDWFAKDDDFSRKDYLKLWRKYTEIEDGDGFYSGAYYLNRYGTAGQFVEEMTRPSTPYAFVTPDGEWHAPGCVGWFGMSDETADSANAYWEEWKSFIENGPDCYVSFVDCHI